MEPWSPTFQFPEPGVRVAGTGAVRVLADHEYDFVSFDPSGVRRDWLVRRIMLERRRYVWVEADTAWHPAGLLGCEEIQRMDRWSDDPGTTEAGRYLLDLEPSEAAR